MNETYTGQEMGENPETPHDRFFNQLTCFVTEFFKSKIRVPMADRMSNLKGCFEMSVVCAHTGAVLEQYRDKNLVVNGGRTAVMQLLGAGTSGKQLTQLAVGTNGTQPIGSDTDITGAFIKLLGAVTYPTISSVKFDWTLGSGEANGINIVEFGILCTDNTLFARKVRALIAKNSDIILNGSWTITF